jgi:hypothetical protein
MDFSKLGKKDSPLDVFSELLELDHWHDLERRLEELREETFLRALPQTSEQEEAEEPIQYEEVLVYSYIPRAQAVSRYMLFCYARTSPLGKISDMKRRRTQALDLAGVPKGEREEDGWMLFTRMTHALAGTMLNELLRLIASRVYEMWLSNIIAFEKVMQELRAPVFGLEDDKKAATFERKLKLSEASLSFHDRIENMEKILFADDQQDIDAATSAALNAPKSAFQGGWAEQMATNVG